ncbi:MAG: TraB/GumN family protein [Pseudomonadota bacterium]
MAVAPVQGLGRRLFVLAWGLCVAAAAWSAECAPAPTAPGAAELPRLKAEAQDRGFLWRLRAGGHDSWLYGTLHIGKPAWAFPGPHLLAALQASDTMALEMDPLDPAINARMAQLSTRYAGRWPGSLVPRVQAQMARACVPAILQEKMHPAMLLATIGLYGMRPQQLYAEYAQEFVLSGLAHARGLPVVSMEPPETQARVLLGTQAPTAAALAEGLADLESGHAASLMAALTDTWATSDWKHLQAYADWCDCLKTAGERREAKRMLDDRNPGLARDIDRLHRSGKTVFAAVGALHMVGPQGLVELLQRRGYQVELQPPAP